MSDYGFIDNFDDRFRHGWRFSLWVLGVFQWQWARRLAGGVWENWWVDPCLTMLWHPVTTPSSAEARTAPCPPSWGGGYFYREDYRIAEVPNLSAPRPDDPKL